MHELGVRHGYDGYALHGLRLRHERHGHGLPTHDDGHATANEGCARGWIKWRVL